MTDMDKNEIIQAEDQENFLVGEYDNREYDERVEKRKDKAIDAVKNITVAVKNESIIAKKEADTSAEVTKTHVNAESDYVKSLLKEKEREDITPEECADINNRIEESLKRMNEQDKEARRQVEESPYRKSIPWGKVTLLAVAVVGLGYGGYKILPKLVA